MLKVVDRLENIFLVITFFLATILIFGNVVFRFFGYGTSWSEELIRYLIIWLTFIGASVCVRENEHVSIDLLPEFLSEFWKKILSLFVNTVAIIFLLFITKFSLELVEFSFGRGQIASALGIPMYIVYLCVPIGAMLMTLRYTISSVEIVKDFRTRT